MRMHEINESASLFTQKNEMGGIWVRPDGSHVDCDYENNLHHPAAFAAAEGEEYEGDEFDYQYYMEEAHSQGWVRVAQHGQSFLVEFEHGKAPRKALREVSKLVRAADTGFISDYEFSIMGWDKELWRFQDHKAAMRFWNSYMAQSRTVAEGIEVRQDHESMLTAALDGRDVAWYSIAERNPHEVSLHANVDAAARRQGVSSYVYDWAEKFFAKKGLKLVPFSRLSDEAYAMWRKRNPSSVADYVKDGANWYAPEALDRAA